MSINEYLRLVISNSMPISITMQLDWVPKIMVSMQ